MTNDAPYAAAAPPTQPTEVDFTALQAGQRVGRYEIVAILGQGGFGITYRARDSQLGRDVAIKEYLPSALAVRQDGITVLPRSTRTAEDFTWGRQRFVDEGRTLATLQRASAIVRVFDFLEANGTAYIVMELAPGDTMETRLRQGPLRPDEVDRILWPLLDGLEQVHASGFLHRDIKPANILLDAEGNPTLIDFGAARAAIAGHTSALTAVFTPGYAAAEQMTSAKQGPWTDIYALSATLHHAITGAPPPSAFDRMLEDTYRPLGERRPDGFSPGLLIGIDSGLAVRATDRPQSIAGWRPILAQATAPEAMATMVMGREPEPAPTVVMRSPAPEAVAAPPAPSAPRRKSGLWFALAAVVLLAAGGGAYHFASGPAKPDPAVAEAARQQREAAEAEALRQKAAQEELERLREAEAKHKADDEARLKAEADAALRRQIEEETRRTLEAEAKAKAEEQARLKAEADAAVRRQAEEEAQRKIAAEREARRQFEEQARQRAEADAARQKAAEQEAKQKKADELRRASEEEKARGTQTVAPPQQAAAVAPPPPSAQGPARGPGADGLWRGTYHCSPNKNAGDFSVNLQLRVTGGTGTWVRPGSGPGTPGIQSVTIAINGTTVQISRNFVPHNQPGVVNTGQMTARYDGANTISGNGPEKHSGGRTCEISLTR